MAAIRAGLPDGVAVHPVVKADAYGHGAVPVAGWLERYAAADGLGVATLDEGLELRAAGIGLPILVLYPIPAGFATAAARAILAITAGDGGLIERTLAALAAGAPPDRPLAIHVEVETGLGRTGIPPSDVPAVAAAIRAAPRARLAGVFSHLAAPGDPARSAAQRARFEAAADAVIGLVGPLPDRHLAGSGGLLAASAPPYDQVRPGLAVYGLAPDGLTIAGSAVGTAAALRPVMALRARPIGVADLGAGHGVSYGPSFETGRPSRIATLPLGYADGWTRALSNNAEALVRGGRVPLVGTVAMDAVMADVTDVAGPPVTVDDEFTLLGEQSGPSGSDAIGILELAQERTTISWEVIGTMSRRLPRVYHAAAVPVGVRTLTEEVFPWLPKSSSGTVISATSRSTRS